MKRPALIFDFGNVIAFFDYAHACVPFASRIGLTADELLARIRSGGLDALTAEHETGRMTGADFGRAVCALAGLDDVSEADFAAAWRDIFWLNEPVVRLTARLKARGYTLVLGSNTNALHADDFRRRFAEALRPFDHLVLSYQVGHMKPARAFYDACARAAGAPAEHCVFIDDMPENASGARSAGMTGLVYRDVPTLIADLRAAGVEVADDDAD